jgi:anti-anti-sigma regulatory factor
LTENLITQDPSSPQHTPSQDERCPCPRPFSPTFRECPAYQAVSFSAFDSLNRPLGSWLTCRHLGVGKNPPDPGGFYPRCGLGSAQQRVEWVAAVRPERLEAIRALQAEFDLFRQPYRTRLFTTKAATLDPRSDIDQPQLEQLMAAYLEAAAEFVHEREDRLAAVGLPSGPLLELFHDWGRAWLSSRQVTSFELGLGLDRFDALEPCPPDPATGVDVAPAATETIYTDPQLRIERAGAGLRLAGDIDASNATAVGEVVRALTAGTESLELDFSGVLFCDLGGLRAIVQGARGAGEGRQLVLRGLPQELARAMILVGWTDLPNLVMAA